MNFKDCSPKTTSQKEFENRTFGTSKNQILFKTQLVHLQIA